MGETKKIETEVVVLGSGPGGYTAAFRAADLGKSVVLVEYYNKIGGVCLNVGCIPSKALLHVAKLIDDSKSAQDFGINFEKLSFDLNKVREFKQKIINKLTAGLEGLAKKRKVNIITGRGKFTSQQQLVVTDNNNVITAEINFKQAIIATGSKSIELPFLPKDPRILNSTHALELGFIPKKLLIIGGGIIGIELGTVYEALGSKISVVELTNNLFPGADPDLVEPLKKRMQAKFEKIMLSTKITKVDAKPDNLIAHFVANNGDEYADKYDAILVAVGRAPNTKDIGLEALGVQVDARGFIAVNECLETNISNIYAIGDITGQPMLAHKAIPQGKIAAEVIAGKKHAFEPYCIAAVAYTDPEVAWVGLTETEAKAKNIEYGKGVFPWAASGRALALGRDEGFTKILFDKNTHRVLGGGIVGLNAGDLIAEIALAIEMGCDAQDLALTIHPHPTLSETINQATEAFEGTITDLYMPKKI